MAVVAGLAFFLKQLPEARKGNPIEIVGIARNAATPNVINCIYLTPTQIENRVDQSHQMILRHQGIKTNIINKRS